MAYPLNPKGDPKVVSDTEDEEITPSNPETVKQFPVDTTDKKVVEEVEEAPTKPAPKKRTRKASTKKLLK